MGYCPKCDAQYEPIYVKCPVCDSRLLEHRPARPRFSLRSLLRLGSLIGVVIGVSALLVLLLAQDSTRLQAIRGIVAELENTDIGRAGLPVEILALLFLPTIALIIWILLMWIYRSFSRGRRTHDI